uniref:Uncharacterized protein n=1 Tax=Arundo donax TaxID=35708 RepID=A0A0A9BSD7_ARUDO
MEPSRRRQRHHPSSTELRGRCRDAFLGLRCCWRRCR